MRMRRDDGLESEARQDTTDGNCVMRCAKAEDEVVR